MPFEKGQSGNPDGRPKGAKDKVNSKIREMVWQFLDDNIEDIQQNYDQLEPKEKLQFFEKLLNYALPRMQASEIEHWDSTPDLPQLTSEQVDQLIEKL